MILFFKEIHVVRTVGDDLPILVTAQQLGRPGVFGEWAVSA